MYGSLSDSNAGDMGLSPAPGPPGGIPSYFMASFYPMDLTVDAPLDRALLASKNHREAEKRRRERIKSHMDRLRTLLACDPKTDKASLLAKAVEHVRDLKQRTAEIAETQLFPSESDEIIVIPGDELSSSDGRRLVYKASLCCEDRSDLLPELIDTLRALRLKTLRAEMATLGGRVRNVLVLAGDSEGHQEDDAGAGGFLKDALKELVDRRTVSGDRLKRRRTVDRDSL
ncbi:ACT-like protein [Dioscorea alata]|uniref:ACT-like protein n=1 Tax=Dioscorea alata TaxID=55571 RepID=A0ACB7VDL0_DIOAL|nr:ACT-like protein [Dioscorea alata]